ncbi:succinate-semialdehyde dehydrogenase/glutarate-semialdehyde dehydrogenase [Methanohalophilus levihalophilus]|uniref:NAD-dependent succinate-semialdehyde dehydrogenase n=1 Tax=Methanohalophilus levihalophilus TaxID=1431282 RepID=UPI001AEAA536|nr:NAD-dependent succinate-semialdehyde dehydrogenase [Methanohalophilus levihalophilus]MBP2030032.1 succinate-semialdehyde dehydrogenase/glutarate-semialdehyde dehydrogenase [Methanohalophilus levihalophilus]
MKSISSINPATGQINREFAPHSQEEIAEKVQKSGSAFEQWSSFDISERTDYLRNISSLLRGNKEELGHLITMEMGKPIKQARAEISKCAVIFDYYADHAERLLASREEETDAEKSTIFFEPMGTVLCIKPWNFPFWQVLSAASHILVGGNVILLKHSSYVPECALKMEELFIEAGVPEGVFQTLLTDSSTASSLIGSDKISAVSFTGGTNSGRKIAVEAASHMKKFVLELGGSDPFVVLEDADVREAVKVAAPSRFINTGQTCIASKRFIVHESIADEFTAGFVEETMKMKVGNPFDEDTDIGPMVRPSQVKELDMQVRKSLAMGAKLELEGGPVEGKGFFYSPVILSNANTDMPVMQEETFGPVAPIVTFKDRGEAIRLANATPYGLGGSVWSGDKEEGMSFAKKVHAGIVGVNGFFRPDACLPFGGMKHSGMGRELSDFGLYEFMHVRSMKLY